MTTHDKDKIIAAAKECFDCYEDGRGRLEYSADEYGIERFYAIAFAAGAAQRHAEIAELVAALEAMLTHMGMDEDEWNKPTFNQARAALAKVRKP